MRLIDADKLYEILYEIRMDEVEKYGRIDTKHCCSLSTALYEIYNAPTIDPVKHGRWAKAERHGCWSYSEAYKQCSECGNVTFLAEKMNYCPNCGTRMDEVME